MIDFKEIPKANGNEGQDTFELFARDFFRTKGYEIIVDPSRGADGGADIIAIESRETKENGTLKIKWLISCKHYAHSKNSISPTIESDITDRVNSQQCDGFIAFYSSIPSSGLSNKLNGLKTNFHVQVFDYKKIESEIVGFPQMETLFMRYFPKSYKYWKEISNVNEPTILFDFYIRARLELIFKSVDAYRFLFYDDHNDSTFYEVLLKIFKTSENILRALKNTKNFKDFIQYSGITLILEDPVEVINEHQLKNNQPIFQKCLLRDLDKLYENALIPNINSKYLINIKSNELIMSFHHKDLSFSQLYVNALILSRHHYSKYEEIYKKELMMVL